MKRNWGTMLLALSGLVPLLGLSSRPPEVMLLIFGLYVFAVHGAAAGLAIAPILHRFDGPLKSRSWVRFPVVVGLMVGLAFAGCWMVQMLAGALGGLPPKRSIIEHPFW